MIPAEKFKILATFIPRYLKFLRADFGIHRLINNGLSLRKRSIFENIEG